MERGRYLEAIDKMIDKISGLEGFMSAFQIGSISTPGISDIDLVIVFEEGYSTSFDPRRGLSDVERYLFTHTLYGISVRDFDEACQYTFFHNYKHLAGQTLETRNSELSPVDVSVLKTQIALEFLIKMYITLVVELTYKIVKVRSLLLHIKALRYDMDFLNISSGRVFELILELTDWRSRWFEKKMDEALLQRWLESFYTELRDFLAEELRRNGFFVPVDAKLRVGRNIQIKDSTAVGFKHRGITLPSAFAGFGRKYFNLQHRFNRFEINLPCRYLNGGSIVNRQIDLYRRLRDFNRSNFPNFLPLTPSLNLF